MPKEEVAGLLKILLTARFFLAGKFCTGDGVSPSFGGLCLLSYCCAKSAASGSGEWT
jgi:hypothetical protein